MQAKSCLSICLAHLNAYVREETSAILVRMEHHVLLKTDSGQELLRACAREKPDLIIASLQLRDMDAVETLKKADEYGPFPSILTTTSSKIEKKIAQALFGQVMICLTEPVREEDLRANIPVVYRRFMEYQALCKENQELRDALESRKVIEKAKGILMKEQSLDEQAAYSELQRRARDSRGKMADVAEAIIRATAAAQSAGTDEDVAKPE